MNLEKLDYLNGLKSQLEKVQNQLNIIQGKTRPQNGKAPAVELTDISIHKTTSDSQNHVMQFSFVGANNHTAIIVPKLIAEKVLRDLEHHYMTEVDLIKTEFGRQ